MKYRNFGKVDFQVSPLGFGAMRLSALSAKAVHYAIEHGVNYIDTAYSYHEGLNEILIGKILKQANYREKVKIATKQPCWLVHGPEDPDKFLNEQLKKLQTDHIDFYLLHALYKERWDMLKCCNILDWAERAIRQGKIGHFGFSFHDSFPAFKEIIDDYDHWEFCYIQYNYMNENVQAGTRGLEYATAKGLAVVVMEPLLGGALVNPPPNIRRVFEENQLQPVDTALRWLWNKPEISCVLSGMTRVEQVEQNIRIAEQANMLLDSEMAVLSQIKNLYEQIHPIPCTKCRYCMPCPNSVDIPFILELYNEAMLYDKYDLNKTIYRIHIPDASKGSSCTGCRLCERKCPQKIGISEWMSKIDQEFSGSLC